MTIDLRNINTWKQHLGHLPILFNPKENLERFLMLNGGQGDFCLQTFTENDDTDLLNQYSWSTNTKNYLVVVNHYIKIINWYDNNTEKIEVSKIQTAGNFEYLYRYLKSKSFKTQSDVIPVIIDIFRQLRGLTLEKQTPIEAINLLFTLLISLEEDYTNIDIAKWNINEINIPNQFEHYTNQLQKGVKSIKPNLDLILRHISGSLFQEAHKEVIYFDPQLQLWGTSSKLQSKRSSYSSIHYTPQYIARTIVENCLKDIDLTKANLRILDPSCGSSEFIIEVLKQLKNLKYAGSITVKGYDTSEIAIKTSKFLLQYENRTQWDNKLNIDDISLVDDALTVHWGNDNDIIVMNPPYVSWELLKNKADKDNVTETLGKFLSKGKPNQASAFFYKASISLNDDGALGCIIPSSIFTNDTYLKLRDEVQQQLTIKLLAKLGNFVFEDALTDVSLFIAKKPKQNLTPKLIWTKNEKGIAQDALRELRKLDSNKLVSIEEKSFSIYNPHSFPSVKDSWRIVSFNEDIFLKSLNIFVAEKKLVFIEDIFKIHQGVLLGTQDIFIISKLEFKNLPKNEQKYFRPVITSNTFKLGNNAEEYLWYPYNNEGLMLKTENELSNISFAQNSLFPKKEILEKRKGVNLWWTLTRERKEMHKKEMRLYSNRFGNSNSFVFDATGACVVEEGNALVPRKKFEFDDFYFYLSVFSSKTFDKLLSIYSKQLAGGNWYDLGAKYTANIPIPNIKNIDKADNSLYSLLVDLGKELEKGNTYLKSSIDEKVKLFYPNY